MVHIMSNDSNEKYNFLGDKTINEYVGELVKKPKAAVKKSIAEVCDNDGVLACKVGIELINNLKNTADKDYDGFKDLCDNSIKTLNNLVRNENLTSEAQVEIVKTINKIVDKGEKAFNKKLMLNAGFGVAIIGALTFLANSIIKSSKNGGIL